LGSGGLKCENSVPKFERESNPDHWGGPIDPNFVDHLVMFIKHGLHQKSHISGHLLRRPPLVLSFELQRAIIGHMLDTCTCQIGGGVSPISAAKFPFQINLTKSNDDKCPDKTQMSC